RGRFRQSLRRHRCYGAKNGPSGRSVDAHLAGFVLLQPRPMRYPCLFRSLDRAFGLHNRTVVCPVEEIPMSSFARCLTGLAAYGFAAMAFAANLTIGMGTDVTAIDPHYHNLTPNNTVAAHIFGYLVERNEKSQPIPGLATEWKT